MEKTKLVVAWVIILALWFAAWYQVSQKSMLAEVGFVAQQVAPAGAGTTKWWTTTNVTTAGAGTTKWWTTTNTNTTTATTSCLTKLDLNVDKNVNTTDLQLISSFMNNKTTKWLPATLVPRDANKDGKIDANELGAYGNSYNLYMASNGTKC